MCRKLGTIQRQIKKGVIMVESITVTKISTEDRAKLKELSKLTGKTMQFLIGELIRKEYKRMKGKA